MQLVGVDNAEIKMFVGAINHSMQPMFRQIFSIKKTPFAKAGVQHSGRRFIIGERFFGLTF